MSEPKQPEAPDLGILELLEPEFVSQTEGAAEIVFKVKREFTIGAGVVQGGIVAAMLDMAMAMSSGDRISTASMQFDILRPVTGDALTVNGRIAKRGRRIVFAEAEMHDSGGRLVARGRQTAVPIESA